VADGFLKQASLQTAFKGWKWLVLGMLFYILTALGWFLLLKKAKLSTLGALYSVSSLVFLALLSIFYFKEKLSPMELVGFGLAVVSMIILAKYI